jgi:hypothetical protein
MCRERMSTVLRRAWSAVGGAVRKKRARALDVMRGAEDCSCRTQVDRVEAVVSAKRTSKLSRGGRKRIRSVFGGALWTRAKARPVVEPWRGEARGTASSSGMWSDRGGCAEALRCARLEKPLYSNKWSWFEYVVEQLCWGCPWERE